MATERKISGEVYRCEPIAAEPALSLFGEMMSLFDAETLGAVRDGMDRKGACENFLVLFAGQSDKPRLVAFFKSMVELCRVGSDTCVVGHKPESMEDIAEVGFFAVEVQFRPFLLAALPVDTKNAAGAAA